MLWVSNCVFASRGVSKGLKMLRFWSLLSLVYKWQQGACFKHVHKKFTDLVCCRWNRLGELVAPAHGSDPCISSPCAASPCRAGWKAGRTWPHPDSECPVWGITFSVRLLDYTCKVAGFQRLTPTYKGGKVFKWRQSVTSRYSIILR